MNRTDNSGTGIAGLGRGEDSMLAHVAPGEMVVPPVISPQTQKIIEQEMMSAGLDPSEYTVGQGMSINPITGMAEFGFLKKLGKSLKKVVKKVAPVLSVAMPFIPGLNALSPLLQGAISAGVGKAAGLDTKDALLAGLTTGIGAKIKGPPGGITDAASKSKFPKLAKFFNPAEDATGIFGGKIGPNIRGGIGNIFTQRQPAMTQEQINELTPEQLAAYQQSMNTGPFGGQFGPFLRDTFLGTSEDPGLLRNIVGGGGEGGGLGGNAGLMAMAALYGKAVKEDFKRKEGGLKDIRQSVRPDLMPAPTFTGFDLGVRPGMKYGGSMDEEELDMRMGGPSIGPGTGTSDDIPAMLSDGEFVMTSAANNGLGGFKVTKTETGIELIPNGKPNRQKGAKNMDKLMKTFEQFNKVGQA
jgi:hypothetical protein